MCEYAIDSMCKNRAVFCESNNSRKDKQQTTFSQVAYVHFYRNERRMSWEDEGKKIQKK